MAKEKWSQDVTGHPDALDPEDGVFKQHDPAAIAAALERSAGHGRKRKGTPYRSAMSMLTFSINRAGDGLDARQRTVLEDAKDALREALGRG